MIHLFSGIIQKQSRQLPAQVPGKTTFVITLVMTLILSGHTGDLRARNSSPATGVDQKTWDLVVYGGTSAGVIAAVQAKRMGLEVVVVSPDIHLGGLTSGGLGFTDTGNKEVIGGLARDFYHRIWKHYQNEGAWKWEARNEFGNRGQGTPAIDGENRTMWLFEPHVAEMVFEELVTEFQIPVFRDEWLDRENNDNITMEQNAIKSFRTLSGKSWHGKMYIDATYEGDLMAEAGVKYFVGREGNDVYGETLNGVQIDNAVKHQFEGQIDPYVIPGDSESGLLPRIHDGDPGRQGEGDHRLQAYNYRVCLTKAEENRLPFPKPDNYDPATYELLLRTLQAGSWHIAGKFDLIPNAKTDTNNHGSFSTDNIGMNYDYPEASYERRNEILKEHENYQKGYFYFIANDKRVPAPQREWMAQWGLARDEFTDNGHWPHQIYVREARRMVSDFVMTENHVRGTLPTPRSIGMGSYNMDSHNTQRYVDKNGFARNEGDVQVSPGGPYPIDYGAIVPADGQCRNLLVPVCLSSSHIAFGSIRMEPVFMILGQSAATAASIAINESVAVQDVDYGKLKARLLEDNQVLRWAGKKAVVIPKISLPGVVVDDSHAQGMSKWTLSQSVGAYVEYGYRHDGNTRKGELAARFQPGDLASGMYEVRLSYTPHPNRATNVPVSIHHALGITRLTLNQQQTPNSDKIFHSLGHYRFQEGGDNNVTISNTNTDGYVIIDAVQWLPAD